MTTMPLNKTTSMRQSTGFALLEVLIAVVVLAVALLSLAGLHAAIIKSASQAKARGIAASLAQEKLDDLRSYGSTTADSTFTLSTIANNAGGAVDVNDLDGDGNTTELLFPSGTITVDNVTYTRNWYVKDDTTTPGTKKLVTMVVSWNDENNQPQHLALQSAISNVDPYLGGAGNASLAMGAPEFLLNTSYVESNADPIQHDVGVDVLKKSTQPVPDTTQHELSTITTFKEEYYNDAYKYKGSNTYVTVNCQCIQQGTPTGSQEKGWTPAQWGSSTSDRLGQVLNYTAGQQITDKRIGVKDTGGQLNEQPAICTICCRDHHDGGTATVSTTDNDADYIPTSTKNRYDPWRTSDYNGTSNDHNHYVNSPLAASNGNNSAYYEACRMVWSAGRLQTLQDWHMEDLRIFPASFFATTSNVTLWATYVREFVEAYLKAITSSYPTTTPTIDCSGTGGANCGATSPLKVAYDAIVTAANTSKSFTTTGADTDTQLATRAIYIDYMTPELVNELRCRIDPSAAQVFGGGACPSGTAQNLDDFIFMVPFHDVNVTKFAGWGSNATSVATVTNQVIEDGSELTYNRGMIRAVGAGSATITATIRRSNSGLTDTTTIDELDSTAPDSNYLTRTFAVTVSGTPPPPPTAYKINVTINIGYSGPTSTPTLTMNGSACTLISPNNWDCYLNTGSPATGTLVISTYNKVKLTGAGSPSVTTNRCVAASGASPAVTLAFSGGGDNTTTESTTINYSGVTANGNLTLTVRDQTSSVGTLTCP